MGNGCGVRRHGGLLGVAFAALALIAGANQAMAQGGDNNAACALKGRDTVIASGSTVRQCLDVASLKGKSYVIPSNVTRIDASGFSLCESSVNQGGLADIVYVMDQSGSMAIGFVWISPNQMDTVYLHGVGNCRNAYSPADQDNYGTVTVLRGTGTIQIKRLNPAKDPRLLCVDYWSGDPYHQRDIAFRSAIDFQAARAPESRAGYLGFSSGVQGATTPRPLNSPANIAAVKQNITINNGGATNYAVSLEQAKTWLSNPALSPNATKAVIFLSDGKPSPDSTAYLNVLQPAGSMPPVYGIFLGVPRPDTIRLSNLSQATGGRFFLIPPDRPDSLRAVVEQILNIIFKQFQPYGAQVRNASSIPVSVGFANSTSFVKQENNSWLMRLNGDVALRGETSNSLTITDTLREITSGEFRSDTANFTLSTTGPVELTNRILPGTPFSISCQVLPPDINIVRNAYIKDTDGDGAGDKVFFVFSRPLQGLPASIDSVYWNKVDPAFANKLPPKLSFLPGSNNTIVVADFTASPYTKGLTSIPPGETPVGVLPPGGVFLSQRPAIKDSMGPIIDSGLARPFDNSKVTSGGALNLDTLVIHISEKVIAARGFNNMLFWGKPVNGQCNDFANARPVTPAKNPEPNGDQTVFHILVQNGVGGPTPVVGDCIYLNVNGDQTDVNYNIPPIRGVQLRGRRPPREIELMRGYPPVVGFTADQPGFLVVTNDPRNGGGSDFSKPNELGQYVISWVPPVGWVADRPFAPMVPVNPGALPIGQELTVVQPMPRTISTLQIVSTGKYIADVSVYDTHGRFMKSFRQAFGYQGELNNSARVANKGLVSYLVWDMKDSKNQKAGQGVFIWKVLFTFENNKQEIQYTRTGVMRNIEWFLKP